MIRPSLAVLSALILASSLAAVALGQSTSRQATLAERMAALRRGWTHGQQQAAATDPPQASAQSPQPQTAAPQPQSRSFLPSGLLGRRPNAPPAQRVAPPASTNSAAQIATRPRAGSVQANPTGPSPQQAFTLPGLGGSRLPTAAAAQPLPEGPAAGNISRELSSDYPVIQGEAPGAAASRYATSPPRTAQLDQSAVRSSPQRRAPMHVGPNDLQRELVGTFPTSPTNEPAAESSTPTDDEDADADAVTDADANTQAPSESPLAMPATPDKPAAAEPTNDDWVSEDLNAPKTPEIKSTPVDTPAAPQFRVIDSANAAPRGGAVPNSSIDLRSAFSRGAPAASVRSNSAPFTPTADRQREAFGDPSQAKSSDTTLLVSQQTPIITTDIRGPRQILVGREATYRVRLENKGTIAAEGIVASIRIPSWADVIDTNTSDGTVQPTQTGTTGLLEWQIVRLDARAAATLEVRLVPRNSRPLELGVSYTVSPVGSRAVVEVQEPKLGIHVTGPDEVLYGKPQVFRLTISNPGTGVAENVKIDLLPPGGGDAAVTSHPLGDLAAGSSKTIEVELTAREAGKLAVKAHATAEGGLAANADKEIFCRKPELQVDWRGPDQKYAGTQATYYFRVRNPGTAAAQDVTVRVSLPEGAEYAGASEGQSLDAQRREVSWRVGSLGPGDDHYMELRCLMQTPGTNQLKITAATAAGDLADNKLAETNVVALADLKLEVSDPSGPVAVGEEAIYEIRVKNRGASAAKDVNIVALFSAGIEPDQVEGAHSVADGRVTFRAIDELPAGREVAFRIRAHAVQAGTHVFRAEVLCRDSEIKLAAEETTRFYADDLPAESTPEQQSAQRSQQFDEPTVR